MLINSYYSKVKTIRKIIDFIIILNAKFLYTFNAIIHILSIYTTTHKNFLYFIIEVCQVYTVADEGVRTKSLSLEWQFNVFDCLPFYLFTPDHDH